VLCWHFMRRFCRLYTMEPKGSAGRRRSLSAVARTGRQRRALWATHRVVSASEAQPTSLHENYASHRKTPSNVLPTGSCGSQSTNHCSCSSLCRILISEVQPCGSQLDLGLTSRPLAWNRICRVANHDGKSI
jgi:hypothetical protein